MLTLAIPYHSNPQLLQMTIRSVLDQDDCNWFVIVCDDSSEGSAESVVRFFQHTRISYVRNPNPAGMVANWNFSISQVATEWVCLLHADDEIETSYVSTMRALARDNSDAAILYCQARVIDSRGRVIFSFPDWVKKWIQPHSEGSIVLEGESAAAALLAGNFIFCPSACYRTNIIRAFPFRADLKMVQDLELYLRLLESGQKIVGSSGKHYRYRRHENATAIMTRELTRFHEEIALYTEYAARFAQKRWTKAQDVASAMRIVRLHLFYRILIDLLTLRWSSLLPKIKIVAQTTRTKGFLSRPPSC